MHARVERSNKATFSIAKLPHLEQAENIINSLAQHVAAYHTEQKEIDIRYANGIQIDYNDADLNKRSNQITKITTDIIKSITVAETFVAHKEKILAAVNESFVTTTLKKIKDENLDKFQTQADELKNILNRSIRAQFKKSKIAAKYKEFYKNPAHENILDIVAAINKILRNESKFDKTICQNLKIKIKENFKSQNDCLFTLESYKKFPEQISMDMSKLNAQLYKKVVEEEMKKPIIIKVQGKKALLRRAMASLAEAVTALKEFANKNLLKRLKTKIDAFNILAKQRENHNKLINEHIAYAKSVTKDYPGLLCNSASINQLHTVLEAEIEDLKKTAPDSAESVALDEKIKGLRQDLDQMIKDNLHHAEEETERKEQEKQEINLKDLNEALYTKISNELMGSPLLRKHFPAHVDYIAKTQNHNAAESLAALTALTTNMLTKRFLRMREGKQPLLDKVPESIDAFLVILNSINARSLQDESALTQIIKNFDKMKTNYDKELHPMPPRGFIKKVFA
jgi:hypothetical protein